MRYQTSRAGRFEPGHNWRLYQSMVEACSEASRGLTVDGKCVLLSVTPNEDGSNTLTFDLVRPGQAAVTMRHIFHRDATPEQIESTLRMRCQKHLQSEPSPAMLLIEKLFPIGEPVEI